MSNLENLLGAPSVSGAYIVSTSYQTLGVGSTDRIFLLGHGYTSNLALNDPYLVQDLQTAVDLFNKDSTCPLVRGMLEAYYSGARDIYLVAVDDMSNYVADLTQRNDAWYQNYANKLQATYGVLKWWDLVDILVPLNAPFNEYNVDFLTPLADHCNESLDLTGRVRIALMGTLKGSPITQADINTIIQDERVGRSSGPLLGSGNLSINLPNEVGVFVSVFVGEGVVQLAEMPSAYVTSPVASIAAVIAASPISASVINSPLPAVLDLLALPTQSQIGELANAGFNPLVKTTVGKRGKPFQVIAATDNTLAPTGSDYWSLTILRAIGEIVKTVSALGTRYLGGIGMTQFQSDTDNYMRDLVHSQQIQNYKLDVSRDPSDRYNVLVNLAVTPFAALRAITFSITVGPGA